MPGQLRGNREAQRSRVTLSKYLLLPGPEQWPHSPGRGWMTAKGLGAGSRGQPRRSAMPQFPQRPPHVTSKRTSGSEGKQATTGQPGPRALPVDRRPRGARGGAGGEGPELPRGAPGWRRGVASAGPGPLPGREGGGGAKGKAARAPPARLLPWPGPAAPRWPRPARRLPGGRAGWAPHPGSSPNRLVPPPPDRGAAVRKGGAGRVHGPGEGRSLRARLQKELGTLGPEGRAEPRLDGNLPK